jgi:ABC-type dipeptide/oligopeptide/nickel transport system permease component
MLHFALRRALQALPIAWLVATLVFSLLHVVPGDPVEAMLGENAAPGDVAALRAGLGLDRPLVEQYGRFLAGLVRADLGASLRSGTPVARLLAERWPATLALALTSLAIALALALPLGVLAARRAGGAADRAASALALVGASVPTFWLGPALILIFGIGFDLVPVSGNQGWRSLVLPGLTLGLGIAGLLVRMVRVALAEELGRPYVLVALARGVGGWRATLRHAFRNALPPVITMVALQFGALLAGAVVVETVFSWPGIGRLMVDAIRFRDYPVVQGVVLCIALGYVAANLAADLACAWADPRLRDGARLPTPR